MAYIQKNKKIKKIKQENSSNLEANKNLIYKYLVCLLFWHFIPQNLRDIKEIRLNEKTYNSNFIVTNIGKIIKIIFQLEGVSW